MLMQPTRLLDSAKKSTSDPWIIHSTTLSSPPSIVLEAIERYLKVRGNVLNLVVPVGKGEERGSMAFSCEVSVESEGHPNKAIIGRFDDRLELQWSARSASCPSFKGRLTIRPFGTGTELILKGQDQPLPDEFIFSARLGQGSFEHAMSAAEHSFLEQLKAVLEVEFEMFTKTIEHETR